MGEQFVEALARATYEHLAPGEGRGVHGWSELSDDERVPNLESARFVPVILTALGLAVVAGDVPERRMALTDEEVEAGARLEHLRWCRFTRRVGRAGHPDLVPWAELDEPTRELDRVRVRELPMLLAGLGYSVTAR